MTTRHIDMAVSDKYGNISSVSMLSACGMKAGIPAPLKRDGLIKLPTGSRLFMLPCRMPVGYDDALKDFAALNNFYAVAAFLPPGYTVTSNPSYVEEGRPEILPLFAYASVASIGGEFYASTVRVDKDIRHDGRFIDMTRVRKNIKDFRKIFPHNRLVRHLEDCALINNCPNAQNFFLKRFEAPLPTSPSCNASCAGCISFQPAGKCPATQARIRFVPRPEEIKEIAVFHINNVPGAIVSFGQGCEGEPLLCADTIRKAITLIRRETSKGTINMNTNGSKPEDVARLFDAGLDSIRVSMNSAREKYYTRYYKPRGYGFSDVLRSIKTAKDAGGFVSVNYLTMPGFTDLSEEYDAFKGLIRKYKVDMVQWRNMNYDPLRYFEEIGISPEAKDMLGIEETISVLRKSFPRLKMGYFNPRAAAFRHRRCRG